MHNPKLADKQGLDQLSRDIIDKLHLLRDFLEYEASVENDTNRLVKLYDTWYSNEVLLQKVWKFEPNLDYIRFWEFPKCVCPKMDNSDNYPHGRYVVRGDCIYHGSRQNTH